MKKIRRIIGLLMVVVLVLGLMSACKKNKLPQFEDFADNYVEALPENAEDGLTLHAFNWTYREIMDNLESIQHAGFKNILTMPVQEPKEGGSAWWAFYQPLSFFIGNHSALGTKADLEALCSEAEKYGICILADLVVNHMANLDGESTEEDGTPVVSPVVELYEPVLYRNRNEDVDGVGLTFHHNYGAGGSGADTQYYAWGNLPDLDTSNAYVQERVLSLMKECIDAGVDGFRFDAAKHVETSSDPDYPSDFWENTLEVAKEYYKEKTGKNLYVYGEILATPTGRDLSCYTKYMRITDDGFAGQFKNAFASKDPNKILEASLKVEDANLLIAWVESHDEYVTASTHYSDERTAKFWSIIAAKKGLGGLYLARPTDELTVGRIGSDAFVNPYVAAANHFHNRFYDAETFESADGSCYVSEKIAADDQGALILNLDEVDPKKTIQVAVPHLDDGNYYDAVTGNLVVVSKHVAYVQFDTNGMAVLTRSKGTYTPIAIVENDNTSAQDQEVTLIEGGFNVIHLADEYLNGDYELYIWSWQPGVWSQNYEIKDGVMLVDTTGMEGFLIAVFEKGYQIEDVNNWDPHVIKQSVDIKGDLLEKGYLDMTGF